MDGLERLRRLCRIETVASKGVTEGSYLRAANLLREWLNEIPGIETRQIEFVPGKPVVIGSLEGSNKELTSILLSGHYDVVPAEPDLWSVKSPFAAESESPRPDKKIIARGTQDMKSVLVQYIEALRRLQGNIPERSVHVSFLPDEEVGGLEGAKCFVESDIFKSLNVGIALDEGLANPDNVFSVFYGERASCWVVLRAKGPVGHGSRFVRDTAIEKIARILNRIYSHRKEMQDKHVCHSASLGSLLSMNVTAMKAGVPSSAFANGYAVNVIPSQAEIAVDIRVPLHLNNIEEIIRKEWIQDEQDIEIHFIDRNEHPDPNLLSYPLEQDKWISALSRGIKNVLPHVDIHLDVFPAGTDGRYIRNAGVPCIGFSPMRNTPILLHDNDEYITESTFLEGVQVYENIIKQLSSVK